MTNQEKLLSAFKERRLEDFQKLLQYWDIDVDYFYGEPDNGTLLDLATRSCLENEEYVYELIRNGAKTWRKDEETGKLEIHKIFSNIRPGLVERIWDGVYFSSISGNDDANIMKVAVEENDIEAIELLARSYSRCRRFEDSSVAQHLILLQGSIDAIRLFIKYFDVDEFSKHDIILQKYPQLEAELPTPSGDILFSYLEKGVPELFVRLIAEQDISTEILNMKTYLHLACERNYIDVVDALLKKNVHLNQLVHNFNQYARTVTPIMLAAFYGHYEIFRKLFIIPDVELQNSLGSGSVLHLVLHGMQFKQDQNISTDGHRTILELILKLHEVGDTDEPVIKDYRLNIQHTNESGRTALYYAFKYNNEFAIKLLLRAGAKLYQKDQYILSSISVAIIEGYFDDCIRSTSSSHKKCGWSWTDLHRDEDNAIVFDYKIFKQLDLYSIATESKRNFFARFESVTEMRKLYKHPLTKSLLYLKWSLVKKYYYFNLGFYLSFTSALSSYIFQIQHCLPSLTNFNSSGSTDTAINRDASSILCDVSLWMWLITFLLYIVLILRELCQFSISIRRYFGILENWLELTTIVVIGFLFADHTNTHLAATAILMSWIGLILLLGKLPSLSIYIEMFKTVALNFAKFLLLYSILIASFAYSFFILFRNKTSGHASPPNQTIVNTTDGTTENSVHSWQNLQMSFFRSIIMMTGEFDASNLPLDSNFGYGHVFFILFIFLVTMVLYSLLNGLAVSDTRLIMEDAEVVALMSRAKLILQVERLAISKPFRHHAYNCRAAKHFQRGYIFLRNKLFGGEIRIDETKQVWVYPTIRNRIEINGKNFGKMPSTIVKYAEEILDKRKRSKLAKNQNSLTDVTKNILSEHQFVNELVHQFSEQISDLKLEIGAKIAARDKKLLQNVYQQCEKMTNELLYEQISDLKLEVDAKNAARDEKSSQNVNKRFDQINKLLESVLQEVKSSEE